MWSINNIAVSAYGIYGSSSPCPGIITYIESFPVLDVKC